MKLETEELLRSEIPLGIPAPSGWATTLYAIAAAVAAILALYWDTAGSMVALWASSDTYAHGYLIVPIALALVWRRRREVAKLVPAPDYLGFVLLAGAGFAWLVAAAGQVQVVQQYAMMAMIPAAVVALAGRRVALALAFPLSFLLLAVPFGEAFLPLLMDWTADFTVAALRLTGIPVYREGTFFAIPSGQWSVVEACSGLRYLIASITVGALYAYLTYRRFWKRALFIVLSVVVPVVANFLRAYMIVMIGHLSGMKLAVGIDHFIYGWLFFGLVIGVLFWLGSFWRDAAPASRERDAAFPAAARATAAAMACTAIGVAALAAPWPLYAQYLDRANEARAVLTAPAEASGWSLEPQPVTHWRPHYAGAAATAFAVYRKEDRSVALYLGYYRNQRQGTELVSSQHAIAGGPGSSWASIGAGPRTEELRKGAVELRQTRLRSPSGRLLVWDWYRVAGRDLGNPYLAKALLARDKLLGRGDDSAAIAIAAPYDIRPEVAAETLRLFAREMLPSIDAALGAATPEKPI
jgi:exosortase A